MKITYTGNDLAREVPTMREPKADDYTDFLFVFPDSAYYLALEAYGRHLASLQTIPVLPGHNWIEGQIYEEGRDYWIRNYIENGYRAVLQPIVKQASTIPQPYTGEFLHFILVNVLRGLDQDQQRELIRKISERLPEVNDVASDSKASPSLASHSSTEGNSIEQFIKMKINAAHRNWDKAQKTNQKRWYAGRLKAFHEVLEFLNTEQNPEGSVATPDPSSNEVDNQIK